MNIILLSGGSGKRLWPLSNEIRSKQFIKLFPLGNGKYESMTQRVYRQIKSVAPTAQVTIATSNAQVAAIRNQLGDKVAVCIEPCRRDTFPAIALSVAYLHDVKGVSADESVAVCPVDPFVEHSYYESVVSLCDLAKKGSANLSLMGIEPSEASSKYGYIIPQAKDAVSPVQSFREKPDTKTAKKYISKGALWNAGVFAFKIGYLLEVARKQLGFCDYERLFAQYAILPKISFDYAVVEQEKSIQVLRYQGAWKDVGTWNMMTSVMPENVKGNVCLDEWCSNTHAVNELNIPVLCMGLKNAVVVAGRDGILVADKERSDEMKPYVERICTDVHFADETWGNYTVLDDVPGCKTVKITLNAGMTMSYHSHEFREEVWTIVSGAGRTYLDGKEKYVHEGDVVRIPSGLKHALIADSDIILIEVQFGSALYQTDKREYPIPQTTKTSNKEK